MKRLFLSLCLLAVTMAFISCDANEQIIDAKDLPANSKSFIQKFFPHCDVYYASKEKNFGGVDYEVKLDCQTDLEFDESGNWTEVDCDTAQIPDGIVPASIDEYVKSKYPKYFVVKIDKDRNYEVELNVGLELVFNKQGEFVRIDD